MKLTDNDVFFDLTKILYDNPYMMKLHDLVPINHLLLNLHQMKVHFDPQQLPKNKPIDFLYLNPVKKKISIIFFCVYLKYRAPSFC